MLMLMLSLNVAALVVGRNVCASIFAFRVSCDVYLLKWVGQEFSPRHIKVSENRMCHVYQ